MGPRKFNSLSPEMMDRSDCDPVLLRKQLHSLRQINRFFGGHSAYESTFRLLLPPTQPITILDLCTGSGDHPKHLLRNHENLRFIIADFQGETLKTAQEFISHPLTSGVQANALQLPFHDNSIDFVLCSLALHHFSNAEAITVLQEMARVSRLGAAVIDLTRGSLAFASVWLLTSLWLRDPYTVNDGRASVQAAFSANELLHLAKSAGWTDYWQVRLPWFRQAIGFRRKSK